MSESKPADQVELAAFVNTGEIERLYAGLSVLVCAAADRRKCAALLSFGAARALLADEIDAGANLAGSLRELWATARELDALALYLCSATASGVELPDGAVEDQLDGVMSTPRFLSQTKGAQLLFI